MRVDALGAIIEGSRVDSWVDIKHGVSPVECLQICYKKRIKSELSGNEVHYTISSMLLVKNMLCSKLHCQKVLI